VLSMRNLEWSRGESNPRPLECDSSALPTELRPHRTRRDGTGWQEPAYTGWSRAAQPLRALHSGRGRRRAGVIRIVTSFRGEDGSGVESQPEPPWRHADRWPAGARSRRSTRSASRFARSRSVARGVSRSRTPGLSAATASPAMPTIVAAHALRMRGVSSPHARPARVPRPRARALSGNRGGRPRTR
jgi:hypothetical protein